VKTSESCAFVLSGGGAYAAYELGVMRALIIGASPATGCRPIDPDVLTGTSAGSFNAALFASAPEDKASAALDYVECVWLTRIAERRGACGDNVIRFRGNVFGFLNPACFSDGTNFPAMFAGDVAFLTEQWATRSETFFSGARPLQQRVIEAFDLETFISGEPLRRVLAATVHDDRIRQSWRSIRIAATNWRTGELRVFGNTDMVGDQALLIVLGSSAIPGVFSSIEIEGEPYVDGGVVMNTPLRPAIEAGGSELHVIYMDPDVRRIPLPRLRNSLNTFYRMLVISFGLTVSRDIRTAQAINRRLRRDPNAASTTALTGSLRTREYRPLTIHRYYPTEDLGGTFRWLDFESDHLERLIQRGYEDACAHDCTANRCVLPDCEPDWDADHEPPWVRRDA
jgi:predicted acylesterase/phospholipase RssA